jgi:cell wall-associated NlpC family hydrolase
VSKHMPALATRFAVTATAAAAAALVGVLPNVTDTAVRSAPEAAAPDAATPGAAAPEALTPEAAPATPTRATPTVDLPVRRVALSAPSRAGSAAVSHAMSKLGAPYRWGAAGPSAFDCSGLVSWAYKRVGVSLPRTSRAMSRVGSPVSKSALRPGDLVFFYTPVSHVGIYIGGGKVVNASQPGTPVKVSNISGMPFNSARRV